MAHSIPYKGIERKEIEQLLREAEVVPSFAGSSYAQMHKSVIQEIQIQKDCNGKAVQRGMHMTINSGFDDSLRLQPDIEELIGQLSQIALKHGDGDNPVTTELLTSLQELATSCITTEPQAEPRAERIFVRGENAQSRKLYNIRFNIKRAVSLLFDWILLGNITETTSLQLFGMIIRSVSELYDLSLKEFDTIHAAILQEVFRANKVNGWVDEDTVVQHVLDRYSVEHSEWNRETIFRAITELDQFQCIELTDGKISITETIVIQ